LTLQLPWGAISGSLQTLYALTKQRRLAVLGSCVLRY